MVRVSIYDHAGNLQILDASADLSGGVVTYEHTPDGCGSAELHLGKHYEEIYGEGYWTARNIVEISTADDVLQAACLAGATKLYVGSKLAYDTAQGHDAGLIGLWDGATSCLRVPVTGVGTDGGGDYVTIGTPLAGGGNPASLPAFGSGTYIFRRRYAGVIMQTQRPNSAAPGAIVRCTGLGVRIAEAVCSFTLTVGTVDIGTAIYDLLAQFSSRWPELTISAANFPATGQTSFDNSYDRVQASRVIADLVAAANTNGDVWHFRVGHDRTPKIVKLYTQTGNSYTFNVTLPEGVTYFEPRSFVNTDQDASQLYNSVEVIGDTNPATQQPYRAIVQDATSISTYGQIDAQPVTNTACKSDAQCAQHGQALLNQQSLARSNAAFTVATRNDVAVAHPPMGLSRGDVVLGVHNVAITGFDGVGTSANNAPDAEITAYSTWTTQGLTLGVGSAFGGNALVITSGSNTATSPKAPVAPGRQFIFSCYMDATHVTSTAQIAAGVSFFDANGNALANIGFIAQTNGVASFVTSSPFVAPANSATYAFFFSPTGGAITTSGGPALWARPMLSDGGVAKPYVPNYGAANSFGLASSVITTIEMGGDSYQQARYSAIEPDWNADVAERANALATALHQGTATTASIRSYCVSVDAYPTGGIPTSGLNLLTPAFIALFAQGTQPVAIAANSVALNASATNWVWLSSSGSWNVQTTPATQTGEILYGIFTTNATSVIGQNPKAPIGVIKVGVGNIDFGNHPAPTVSPAVTLATGYTDNTVHSQVEVPALTVTNVPTDGTVSGLAYYYRLHGATGDTALKPVGELPLTSTTAASQSIGPFGFEIGAGQAIDVFVGFAGIGSADYGPTTQIGSGAQISGGFTPANLVVTQPYLETKVQTALQIAEGTDGYSLLDNDSFEAAAVAGSGDLAAGWYVVSSSAALSVFAGNNFPLAGTQNITVRVPSGTAIPASTTWSCSIASRRMIAASAGDQMRVRAFIDVGSSVALPAGVTFRGIVFAQVNYSNGTSSQFDAPTIASVTNSYSEYSANFTVPAAPSGSTITGVTVVLYVDITNSNGSAATFGTGTPLDVLFDVVGLFRGIGVNEQRQNQTAAPPSVSAVTFTPDNSANGISAALTVAFTASNQPTDGSLSKLAIWRRVNGSGTLYERYCEFPAYGLPNPTASQSYTFTATDLTNGQAYDWGVAYEDAQGGEAPQVPTTNSEGRFADAAHGFIGTSAAAQVIIGRQQLQAMPAAIESNGPGITSIILGSITNPGTAQATQPFTFTTSDWAVNSAPGWFAGLLVFVRNHTGQQMLASPPAIFGTSNQFGVYAPMPSGASAIDIGFAYIDKQNTSSATVWPASLSNIAVAGITVATLAPYSGGAPTVYNVTLASRQIGKGLRQTMKFTITVSDFGAKPSSLDSIHVVTRPTPDGTILTDTYPAADAPVDWATVTYDVVNGRATFVRTISTFAGESVDLGVYYVGANGVATTTTWASTAQADPDGDFITTTTGGVVLNRHDPYVKSKQSATGIRNGLLNWTNPSSLWSMFNGTTWGSSGSYTVNGVAYSVQSVNGNGGPFQVVTVKPGVVYSYAALVFINTAGGFTKLWVGDPTITTQYNGSASFPNGTVPPFYCGQSSPQNSLRGPGGSATVGAWELHCGTFTMPNNITKAAMLVNGTTAGMQYFCLGMMLWEGGNWQDFLNGGAADGSGQITSSAPFNSQGAFLNVTGSPTFSYTATSSSISISIPSTTYTRTDKSTVLVPSLAYGPQGGLAASTTYFFNIAYDVPTNAYVVYYYGTTAPTKAQQFNDCLTDGRISIYANYSITTPSSGSGGGSGGGGSGSPGPQCPAEHQHIPTRDHGLLRADQIDIGMCIPGPTPDGWVEVVEATRLPAPLWSYAVSDGERTETFDVNDTHALLGVDGEWHRVRDIAAGFRVRGRDCELEVVEAHFQRDGHYIALEVEGHVYQLGAVLVHNPITL